MFLFVAALFANVSAASFPLIPACALTQQRFILRLVHIPPNLQEDVCMSYVRRLMETSD